MHSWKRIHPLRTAQPPNIKLELTATVAAQRVLRPPCLLSVSAAQFCVGGANLIQSSKCHVLGSGSQGCQPLDTTPHSDKPLLPWCEQEAVSGDRRTGAAIDCTSSPHSNTYHTSTEELPMICHRSMIALTSAFVASTILIGCAPEPEGSLDEILDRYEAEGVVQFLAPVDPSTGDPAGPPTREAFQFLSLDAESRFVDELDIGLSMNDPSPQPANAVNNWICYGESTHAVDAAVGLVTWQFRTKNNSTRTKKQAPVNGTVFHPSGLTQKCNASGSASENTCTLFITLAAGYNTSAGSHRCCEKKGLFGSYDCTDWFGTADAL